MTSQRWDFLWNRRVELMRGFYAHSVVCCDLEWKDNGASALGRPDIKTAKAKMSTLAMHRFSRREGPKEDQLTVTVRRTAHETRIEF